MNPEGTGGSTGVLMIRVDDDPEASPQGIQREYWLEVDGDFTVSAQVDCTWHIAHCRGIYWLPVTGHGLTHFQ